MTTSIELSCRVGLMSRIDYPSDGFRKGLLELAAEVFRREDVHFVILAGGIVDARYVKEKTKKLKKRISAIRKEIKDLEKQQPDTPKAAKSRDDKVAALEVQAERFQGYLDELSPEKMAEQLGKLMPVFKNGRGETIKLYMFPSPAYDGEVGKAVAELLAEKYRSDDIRAYSRGGDRLPIKQAQKSVEVLVPDKNVWMRGDYFSTPVERVLKDRRRQTATKLPDMYVVGCFGSTITKPMGEAPRPFVTVPVLHRLHEVRVNENQIGVRVMTVSRDRPEPVTRNYSFKDHVQAERTYIELPKKLSPRQVKLLEILKDHGKMPVGLLADESKLTCDTVRTALLPLVNRDGKRPKNWPGLRFDMESKRFDFDGYWVRENLRYPVPTEERKIDSIFAFGCLHAGSIYADYRYLLDTLPRVILERNATILVGAGDFVEGIKHSLLLKGEVYGGLNVTAQETLAGEIMAKVVIDVFRERFQKALAQMPGKPAPDQITRLVGDSLLTVVMIPGNHDLWALEAGFSPLVVMKMTLIRRVCQGIAEMLNAKGYCLSCLGGLIESKVVEIGSEGYILPSGLKMAVMHPHMGRTKTTSIRPQEMLDKAADSHLVVGANFHVGEHLEMWEGDLGQRVCLELGTIKRRSDFEDNKLKIVDHGFGYIRLESLDGRIVSTEQTFYGGTPFKGPKIDMQRVFNDMLSVFGLPKG